MNKEKLQQIIQDKNNQYERQALRSAEEIIEAIVHEQSVISISHEKIGQYREELAKLSVKELDVTAVLGDY